MRYFTAAFLVWSGRITIEYVNTVFLDFRGIGKFRTVVKQPDRRVIIGSAFAAVPIYFLLRSFALFWASYGLHEAYQSALPQSGLH